MTQTERKDYYPGPFPQFFPWSGIEVQERIRKLRPGPLAEMLAPFRQEGSWLPCIFAIITYGCNYCCPPCYVDAGPKHQGTEINPEMLNIIFEAAAGMPAIISGGEPPLHSQFSQILNSATKYMSWVTIYTNGSWAVPENAQSLGTNKLHQEIRERMKNFLETLPPYVEVTLPATAFHLEQSPYHYEIIRTATEFANAWRFNPTKPLVDFIVKPDAISEKHGGVRRALWQGITLINHFGIYGLGQPNSMFPGRIIRQGRARNLAGAQEVHPEEQSFIGELHVDFRGVFPNETSILRARGVSDAIVRPELESPIATCQEINNGLLVEKLSHWLG